MNNETTPAKWNKRLQDVRTQLDKLIDTNKFISAFALRATDYDIYLNAVIEYNPLHKGKIMYKGREVRRMGK